MPCKNKVGDQIFYFVRGNKRLAYDHRQLDLSCRFQAQGKVLLLFHVRSTFGKDSYYNIWQIHKTTDLSRYFVKFTWPPALSI